VDPIKEVHLFMDASARRYGGGHRLIRHNLFTARFMRQYYERFDHALGRQAFLEVMLHIALDDGILHLSDIRLMSEYTRTLYRKGGPRRRLGGGT
jgi:hypothetical protein